MTWGCPECSHPNVHWRNVCEVCGYPQPGFDRGPDHRGSLMDADVEEQLKAIQEWLDKHRIEMPKLPPARPPLQPYLGDCGCPVYGTCMSTVCPRAPRIA